ncbi:MAG: uroporphyrinogen decarboxylase family protein [Litorilinea sp.]
MHKKDRVRAALQMQPVDRVPAGFWYHFPAELHTGTPAVRAHLDFYRNTDVDFLKVMNEHLYRVDFDIAQPADWRGLRAAPVSAPFYQGLLDELRQVLDAIGDEVFVMATVHGVFASAFHATHSPEATFAQGNPVVEHLRQNAEPVLGALDAIADSLADFAGACLDAGAHGVYYAALGAEQYRFTEEEFLTWIKPYDLRVLQAIEGRGELNVLHICKDQVRLDLYADYPAHAVNWAVSEQNPSLIEGRALFNRPILGGVDYRGPIVEGPSAAIEAEVHATIREFGTQGLLLGADCTLPTHTPYEHIRTAVAATATAATA